ncbi:hypothetical protein CEXT_22631 [Caerostris extrusa]|uniref:Uncharacterized protein n=1 Tax=Caerostris extrusa TaxID=172846 RepID=A0AAV4MHB9_CAEEX|nr:hypothetical protein CEXT_22631 [Caerostris extrusa]
MGWWWSILHRKQMRVGQWLGSAERYLEGWLVPKVEIKNGLTTDNRTLAAHKRLRNPTNRNLWAKNLCPVLAGCRDTDARI